MKILISNDDGFDSPGIQLLAKAVEDLGEVYVVAPHRERSTAGHSLTLHKPLRIHELGERRFSTSGTPADCIYLGIHHILKEKPGLILSGINRGANLGTDVFYSGTVAAARRVRSWM
ncbi:5'/3'-nucleotidase SurE [bacterium]|nr:5'/3'-nucleotidase SurE [bacterium]